LIKFKRSSPAPTKQNVSGYQTIKGQFSYDTNTDIDAVMGKTQLIREFNRMADTDAVCGAVLLALTQIFKSISWATEDDEDGVLAQSLINAGWMDNLGDILTHFVFGHSVIEVTLTERDANGHVHWKSMHYRPQVTLADWNFSEQGQLVSLTQRLSTGKTAEIRASKCLIFHCAKTQATPRGKSLFRNAYRDWYYKTNIEKIEAIGVERDLTGLPILKAPQDTELQAEDGSLNAVGQWAWQTVRNVKRNSQEGLVLPTGWQFELAGSPGKRQFDLNAVINRYANNMALSMLSQFLVLGVTSSSGSFALAKEQSSLFHIAVEGFAKDVANVVNSQFIGGRALQLFNDLPKQPKLKPVGIERIDISDLASFLGRLLKYNIITPDERLEAFLRDRVALPPHDPETARPLEGQKQEKADVKNNPSNPSTSNPNDKQA